MLLRNLKLVFLVILQVNNYIEYFLDLLGLTKKNSIIYKTRDGLKYIARTRTADRGIVNAVVLEDEYKVKDLNLGDNAVVLDIGGQNGYFSLFISNNVKKVYVYEAVLENYKNIIKNISINKLEDKIFPFNMAVSDRKEKVKIYLSKDNSGGHSAYNKTDDFVEVSATTIKEIFKNNSIQKCDLLKMDIEGGEYNILYDLPDEYFRKIKNICMECHDLDSKKKNLKNLALFLRSKNFNVYNEKEILFAKK